MSDAKNMVDAIERLVDEKIAKAMRGGSSTVPAEYMGEDSEGKAWVVLAGSGSMTPVRRSSVEASVGDTVSVTVADGMAVIDANLSDKSAGMKSVAVAKETAIEAIDYASQANAAASSAQVSANSALRNADIAQASADSAVADAARANEAAVQAISDAADAADAASSAQSSANSARTSADKANYALADMEKVVGTVNWIAEHGEYALTEDTAVDDSKVYYTRSGSGTDADPYVYTRVANPIDSAISTYYELVDVDESIQNFINAHVWLAQDGLYVGTQGTDYKARIDADSLDILDDTGAVVATFGETAQIGKGGESHMELDYHSLKLIDGDNPPNTYFQVNDLRGSDGKATLTETFIASGKIYDLAFLASQIVSVTVNGAAAGYTATTWLQATRITLSESPQSGSTVSVTYKTESQNAKAYTLGTRNANASVGAMSYAEGSGVKASGYVSHAEGDRTEASGRVGHAEGVNTVASGNYSHAEGATAYATGTVSHAEGSSTTASGQNSHAEGDQSKATGRASHAEGWATIASGNNSHAQNERSIALGDSQTVIGRFNSVDQNEEYALIIGNGGEWDDSFVDPDNPNYDYDDEYTHSNALRVDWDGNVECGTVNGVDVTAIGAAATPVNDTTSVESGSNVNVASISLAAGTWMVCAKCQFPNNSTGRRAIKLSTSPQESGNVVSTNVQTAVSGATMQMSTSRCFTLASAGTVYLVAWQNSGGALSCIGNIEATRIR